MSDHFKMDSKSKKYAREVCKCVWRNVFVSQSVQSQGCSSPIVVKFADTQKDKEQRRLQQQLAQQMQQLNTATWGNLTGLGGLTPQYLAVSLWNVFGLR